VPQRYADSVLRCRWLLTTPDQRMSVQPREGLSVSGGDRLLIFWRSAYA